MNIKKVINYIGIMVSIEGILMILPFIISLIYNEKHGVIFIYLSILLFVFGLLLQKIFISDNKFYSAEGFVTVSIGWIILSIFGCLPFYISKEIPVFIDALFETVSGFTTTGATILSDVTKLSKCMNFWRCFTHFVGGMGVLVLMLAIVPTQSENMEIMKAESPGPQVGKLVPKVSDTARTLYAIYVFLTVTAIITFFLSGMPIYDSICIGFGTAGTGGFVVTKNGCADYNQVSQLLIATFMLLFGVNFNVYFLILMKKIKTAFKSEELKIYYLIVIIAILLISINILNIYESVPKAFHDVYFQVSSIMTTTGFAIVDYSKWPMFSRYIFLSLMVVGGCAGSTAGGLKVSRLIILVKSAINEIYLLLHPNSFKIVKFEDRKVDSNIIRNVFSYILIYIFIILLGILIISLENFDFETTISSVFETFNNIGQGLSKVSPAGNFSIFNQTSKITFIILMLTGRLEIFPIVMLFSKKTWKRSI